MKNIPFIIVLTIFLSCNQNKNSSQLLNNLKADNNIKNIEISEFDSSPKDYNLLKYKCISMETTNSQLIEYTYQKGVLKNKKIIKTLNNTANISTLFDNIPKKYLSTNQTFGNPNAFDDGGVNVFVFLNKNEKIVWTLSNDESSYPKEIKPLLTEYKKIKLKFNL